VFKNLLTDADSEPVHDVSLRISKRRGGKYDVTLVLTNAEDPEQARCQKVVTNRVLSIAIEESVDALLSLQIELNRGNLKLVEQKATL